MIEPVINGIIFGLLLSIMLGPLFFALLQTALHEGFKAGAHLAFGALLSDGACITVAYLFASQLDLTGKYKIAVGWIGGLLLIGFGIVNFFRKVRPKEVDDDRKTVHAKFILKGFLMNSFNPAVLLFWLGVISVVKLKEDYTRLHEAVFFASVLATVFGTDLLKSFVAHRISHLLNATVLHWINRIVGSVLIAFGLRMIFKVMW
jgi:threonine/homoserine/homoserine lactone efflux protein